MELTVHIPDDVAQRLDAADGDLSRRALEALALEEYKRGHLTPAELRRMLGFATRGALDGFLKAHGVFLHDTLDDRERERAGLREVFESVRGLADDLDVRRNPSAGRPVGI